MFKFFVNVVFIIIIIWTEVECDEEAAASPSINPGLSTTGLPEVANPSGTINQNDEIYSNQATSHDVVNVIPNPNINRRRPVRKRFELFLSKFSPFGGLFLNVHKGVNKFEPENQRPVFTPAIQPAVPVITWQDVQGPHSDLGVNQNAPPQNDYAQGVDLLQQQNLVQSFRPSLDLSIKGPPIPNIQPLINALPDVLITGYKSFVDKISATSIAWDKAINLPFLSIKKSGKFGTSSTIGPLTSLQTNTVVDGHIDTLVDIRDQYVQNV